MPMNRSYFFGRGRFLPNCLVLFVVAQTMVEQDEQNDESSHARAVEVKLVLHQFNLIIITTYIFIYYPHRFAFY